MKVLIACEYSGAVRDAFIRWGHDAMSCDLLPTEAPGPHYQGDVRDVIDGPWDLLIRSALCATMLAWHMHLLQVSRRTACAIRDLSRPGGVLATFTMVFRFLMSGGVCAITRGRTDTTVLIFATVTGEAVAHTSTYLSLRRSTGQSHFMAHASDTWTGIHPTILLRTWRGVLHSRMSRTSSATAHGKQGSAGSSRSSREQKFAPDLILGNLSGLSLMLLASAGQRSHAYSMAQPGLVN